MKRLLCALLLVGSAWATDYSFPNVGFGGAAHNPPTNLHVKTYPDNGSDYNHVLFTWTTAIAGDSCVLLVIPDADQTGPSVSRKVCDNSIVTSHSVLVSAFMPNQSYGFYVATCTTGPNCVRGDTHWSSSPYGLPNQSVFTFVTTDTNSGHAFDWFAYFVGAHFGLARGHSYNFGINGYKTDGPNSAYTVFSALTMDGQDCFPLALNGKLCGTTHLTVQPICSYAEIVSSGTNNYDTHIFTSGPFSGGAFCNNPNISYEANGIRVSADTSATIGSHTLCADLKQTDSGNNVIGSTQSICYALNVEAVPSYSYTAPTSFMTIPNLAAWQANIFGTDVTTGHSTKGIVQNYVGLVTANTTSPGVYCNDNGSSFMYDFNPCGLLTYRGADQVPLTIADYFSGTLGPSIPAFQASHAYGYGDMICTGGANLCGSSTVNTNYVLVVTDSAGCTSGSSIGSVPAVGSYYSNGTCHLGNAGNTYFWLQMAERAGNQHRDFLLNLGQYTIWQEWNNFPPIELYLRRSAPSTTSQDALAIQYTMFPFVTGHGAGVTQKTVASAVKQGLDSLRVLPYDTENYLSWWIISGTKPIDGGVDEIQIRKDMLVQTIEDKIHYSPVDGVNSTFACCNSYQNFDDGLGAEALIEICAAEYLKTGTCDPIIPLTISRQADYLYSNQFNLTGSDYSQPYEPWTVPYNNLIYNYKQTSLNNLFAPALAFLWAYTGDACTLPTSGVSCVAAADTYFRHTFDNPVGGGISGKEGSQWYKWFADYYAWRTGARNAYQISILPLYNAATTFPGTMEPFPQGEWPAKPTATTVGPSNATIDFYGYAAATSTGVKYGTSAGTINTTQTCGANSLVNSTTGLYKSSCAIHSGLSSSTSYFFGVSETSSAGTGYTQNDITLNTPAPYTFTTTGTAITISGTLPPGTQNASYGPYTLTQSGGTLPCTWSVIRNSLPTGTAIDSSSGVVSGTPTGSGNSSPTIQVSCANGAKPQAFFIHITPSAGGSNILNGLTVQGISLP